MIGLGLIAAAFFAANIGANNSAAEMSTAYGAGVRSKKEALWLIAIFSFLGATLHGKEVILTMGTRLVDPRALSGHDLIPVIVIAIAAASVFFANRFAVPIATTHATVCALAAAGILAGGLRWDWFLKVVVWWMISPALAGILSYFMGRFFYFRFLSWLTHFHSEESINRSLGILVTFSGSFVAFTAGANNAANAAGPLVALGILSPFSAALLSGAGMSLGALFMGGAVLESTGKGITELCATRAIFIEMIAASIILLANTLGIPISLTETVTGALIGLGVAQREKQSSAQRTQVRRILAFWVLSPISVFLLALGVLKILSWG